MINCLFHLTLWEWSRKEQDSCYVRICTKCRSLEEKINYHGSTKSYLTENIEKALFLYLKEKFKRFIYLRALTCYKYINGFCKEGTSLFSFPMLHKTIMGLH